MAAVEQEPIEILLVEDNEPDLDLTMEALQSGKLRNRIHVARDGIEALEFLRRQGKHASAPRPHLVLLDLNMPRMDGREVLEEVAKDDKLRQLPIIVLTSSEADKDVLASYKLGCNSYIVKPVDFEGFCRVIQSMTGYWFTLVVLPQDDARA